MRGMSVTALVKRFETTGLPTAPHAVDRAPVLMPFGHRETTERGEFRIEGLPSGDYLIASSPDRVLPQIKVDSVGRRKACPLASGAAP